MHTSGLFFLRAYVSQAITSRGDRVLLLPLCERDGTEHRNLIAFWSGPAAMRFYAEHGARLKAGAALRLDLDHLRVFGTELHASVTGCQIAPERWPARGDATPSATGPAAQNH